MSPLTAVIRLILWLFLFAVALFGLTTPNLLGGTSPWGPGDVVAGLVLVVGVVDATRHWRFLPLYFTYGVAGGLLYVAVHWPGRNEIANMERGTGPLVTYGCLWLGITLAVGLTCRLVASACHDRPDARFRRETHRCRKCGYLLYGLPEPRCPECGEAFDPVLLRRSEDASQALQELAESQESSADDSTNDDSGTGTVE